MLGGAMYRHGPVAFIKGFIPPDVPWPLLIVIIPIEFIGVFIKAAALAIRLFVNELAGHIVVFSLIGLIVMFGVLALPAFFMAIAIFVLEVFIAFLQAYIFTLLSAVFMGQRYHPAH
jgi:F-type H+-transporting ATPase subunit a